MTAARAIPRTVDALVRTHLGLVDLVATPFRRHSQIDDLRSAGREGLFHAARAFDPARGIPFAAFARRRIHGAMLDHLRSWGPLPKRAVRRTGPVMRVDVDDVQIASSSNPEADVARAETLDRLKTALRVLKPNASTLIRTIYFEGRTLQDAAGTLGVSKSYGSRIVQHGLRRLSNVVEMTRTCAQCARPKPADDFIGRRGKPVTYCSSCRTKYYGGDVHVSGAANVHATGRGRVGSSRERLGLGTRARTENMLRLPKKTLEEGRVHLRVVDDVDAARPRTRGDCENVERPCIFVGCRHNLYLDTDGLSIKYNWPDKEPDEVPADRSCALDIADRGGASLEDVGLLTNVTRERARQIEEKAIDSLQRRSKCKTTASALLREYCDAPTDERGKVASRSTGDVFVGVEPKAEVDRDGTDDEPPTRVSFFAEGERADELVTTAVWTMFSRWQNSRGFTCRSGHSIRASKALARTRAEKITQRTEPSPELGADQPRATRNGTTSMADQTNKRGAMLEATLTGYKAFEAKHGRPPAPRELFEALGEATAKSVSNVSVTLARLVRKGLLKRGAKAAASSSPRAPTSTRKPRVAKRGGHHTFVVEPKPPRASSEDPAVALLIAKRDGFRKAADALDVAIEALSVAL